MTRHVASLGMYDHLAQAWANDALWWAIGAASRAHGVGGVPETLDRSRDVHAIWRDPALLFAQACGYPLVADPTLALRALAWPIYAVSGSVLVARTDDARVGLAAFRGGVAAINDVQSNTGMNLFRAAIAPVAEGKAFFARVVATGAHRASMVAVAVGEADLASIDAVTHAAIVRHEPELAAAVKIVARGPASPGLPFVTAAATRIETVAALRIALDRVMADPALAEARAALFITGLAPADAATLASIADIEAAAVDAGYPELA